MRKGSAYVLAVLATVVFGFGGMIAGGLLGNLIAPARLDWSGSSTPGLLFVGAFLGLAGGVAAGIGSGVRLVRDAKRRHPEPPPTPAARRRRRIALGAAGGLLVAGMVGFSAWPRPICEERERSAITAVAAFGGIHVPVEDMPIEEGTTAPGGCRIVYTVAAPKREVAEHYAAELYRLGWRDTLADLGSGQVIDRLDDERLFIEVRDYGYGDPAWDNLYFDVVVTDLGGARVLVELAVADLGRPYG
jgi:hypothetical protein